MAGRLDPNAQPGMDRGIKSYGTLDADIIIANAPDPVFVSDLGRGHTLRFPVPIRFSPVTLVRELRGASHVMVRSSSTAGDTRPSLKEITHRAMAEAERQAIRLALQGHAWEQEPGGPTPPSGLQNPARQDEAVWHRGQSVPNVLTSSRQSRPGIPCLPS